MSGRERPVAVALFVAIAGCGCFIAAYVTGGNRLYEGASLALATAGFSAAALGWAFRVLPHEQVEDKLDVYPSQESERVSMSGE
ncbi:MAG: hypothetical protein JO199_04855, partial [Candidatus Eremiobacteraeota bacterium]|nr:hypothetical protein [Candidatus Eremiobacteraeota bacterium]